MIPDISNNTDRTERAQLNNIQENKIPFLTLVYYYFLIYLPVIIILSLVFLVYLGYIFNYVLLLITNNYDSEDYPFKLTSSFESAKKKGYLLLILSTIFFTLLLISLLKTIICDPGYLEDPSSLEYQVVLSQCIQNKYNKYTHDHLNLENTNYENDTNKLFDDYKKIKNLVNTNYIELNDTNDFLNKHRKLSDPDYNIDQYQHKDRISFLNDFKSIIANGPLTYSENEKLRNKVSIFLEDEISKNRGSKQKSKYLKHTNDLADSDIEKNGTNDLQERFKNIELSKAIFCGTCLRLKVERSHHCRQCGKCVLKMDHHCPWLANCVGIKNYKFFLLTDIHGLIGLTIILTTYWEAVIGFNISNTSSLTLCFITTFSYACGLGLFGFLIWLAVLNWRLALTNQTVIENADKERFPTSKAENIYDLGLYKNFCNVFGTNPFFWFLPFSPNLKGNGFVFETIYDAMR